MASAFLEMAAQSDAGEKHDQLKLSDSDESGRALLWTEDDDTPHIRSSRNRDWKRIPFLRLHILITTINLLLFMISAIMMWTSWRKTNVTLQDHWRATSLYSPVFDRLQIPKIARVTNGTLFDTDPPSIWRARTGIAADEAWDRVGNKVPPIVMSANEIRAIGKDPQKSVRFPKEYGLGKDAYMASVEVFHHIHCLDKLRKEAAYGHYWEKKEGPAPGSTMHDAHTSHCIDVLIQSLMCTGSVDIITYNWVEGRDMMMADFNNNKVCRDFDAILDWVNENGISLNESQLRAMKPPPDAVRVPNEFKSHQN